MLCQILAALVDKKLFGYLIKVNRHYLMIGDRSKQRNLILDLPYRTSHLRNKCNY